MKHNRKHRAEQFELFGKFNLTASQTERQRYEAWLWGKQHAALAPRLADKLPLNRATLIRHPWLAAA